MKRACIVCGKGFEINPYALKKPSRCPGHRSGWDRKPKQRDLAYIDPVYKRNRALILQGDPACWICGRPGANTADHVISVSRGGSNALENLRPAHFKCNQDRGRDLGNQTKRRRQP